MGFEILYHFYPKKQEGVGYDVESPQVLTKTMGKLEEIPVEKVANVVMSQLARRDIMVFDVEIYEFVKRKITFKETKGGVIIKNKKFLLSGDIEVEVEEVPQQLVQEILAQQQLSQPISKQLPQSLQVLKHEVFDPDPTIAGALVAKYKLTPKKKYPIFEEKVVIQKIISNGSPTEVPTYEYLVLDDTGNKIRVASIHFQPVQAGLLGVPVVQSVEQQPSLMHMSSYNDVRMPVLRR